MKKGSPDICASSTVCPEGSISKTRREISQSRSRRIIQFISNTLVLFVWRKIMMVAFEGQRSYDIPSSKKDASLSVAPGIHVPISPPSTPPGLSPCFEEEECMSEEEDFLHEYYNFSIDDDEYAEDLTAYDLRTNPVVAIIGVGYVGEHLVQVFGARYPVIGYDISETRISHCRHELDHIPRLLLTSEASDIKAATHFIISVPTRAREGKVDNRHLEAAVETIRRYARRGSVVVIESSVAVGTTRELLMPLVCEMGILAGMSPERVDPGRTFPVLESVPKLISGLTRPAVSEIDALYSRVFECLVKVSKPEVAEMTKLYENCQRVVNISFVNEMADAAASIGVDPYEVAAAAATKPYGYAHYTPGLGVGGHCLPENPFFLMNNLEFPLLQKATELSSSRPARIAGSIVKHHSERAGTPPKVLVVGVGFKAGQGSSSNSTGLALARECKALGCYVEWLDPLLKQSAVPDVLKCEDDVTANELERWCDVIVIAVRQDNIDWDVIRRVELNGKVQVEWRTEKPEGYERVKIVY